MNSKKKKIVDFLGLTNLYRDKPIIFKNIKAKSG